MKYKNGIPVLNNYDSNLNILGPYYKKVGTSFFGLKDELELKGGVYGLGEGVLNEGHFSELNSKGKNLRNVLGTILLSLGIGYGVYSYSNNNNINNYNSQHENNSSKIVKIIKQNKTNTLDKRIEEIKNKLKNNNLKEKKSQILQKNHKKVHKNIEDKFVISYNGKKCSFKDIEVNYGTKGNYLDRFNKEINYCGFNLNKDSNYLFRDKNGNYIAELKYVKGKFKVSNTLNMYKNGNPEFHYLTLSPINYKELDLDCKLKKTLNGTNPSNYVECSKSFIKLPVGKKIFEYNSNFKGSGLINMENQLKDIRISYKTKEEINNLLK